MDPNVPIGKMSKKKRKELYAARRGSWGDINPVTRRSEDPKAYNRKKTRNWSDDTSGTVFFCAIFRAAYEGRSADFSSIRPNTPANFRVSFCNRKII